MRFTINYKRHRTQTSTIGGFTSNLPMFDISDKRTGPKLGIPSFIASKEVKMIQSFFIFETISHHFPNLTNCYIWPYVIQSHVYLSKILTDKTINAFFTHDLAKINTAHNHKIWKLNRVIQGNRIQR